MLYFAISSWSRLIHRCPCNINSSSCVSKMGLFLFLGICTRNPVSDLGSNKPWLSEASFSYLPLQCTGVFIHYSMNVMHPILKCVGLHTILYSGTQANSLKHYKFKQNRLHVSANIYFINRFTNTHTDQLTHVCTHVNAHTHTPKILNILEMKWWSWKTDFFLINLLWKIYAWGTVMWFSSFANRSVQLNWSIAGENVQVWDANRT